MAPTLAAEMLPYSVVNCLAFSPTNWSMARRSFRSSSSRPASSATLNTRLSTPAWVSFSSSMRASNRGPMSDTVARTGWPMAPSPSARASQKVTGWPWKRCSARPSFSMRSFTLGLSPPGWEMPDRSPFTSDMKQGTPMLEKCSARVCRVTVLPVPVAPVISPCRLAIWGSRQTSAASFLAMGRGALMVSPLFRVGEF